MNPTPILLSLHDAVVHAMSALMSAAEDCERLADGANSSRQLLLTKIAGRLLVAKYHTEHAIGPLAAEIAAARGTTKEAQP